MYRIRSSSEWSRREVTSVPCTLYAMPSLSYFHPNLGHLLVCYFCHWPFLVGSDMVICHCHSSYYCDMHMYRSNSTVAVPAGAADRP